MSEEWKAMNDAQKQQYQNDSNRAREHYQKEMVVFKAKQAKQKAEEGAAANNDNQVGKKRPAAAADKGGKGSKAATPAKGGKGADAKKAAAKPAAKASAVKTAPAGK